MSINLTYTSINNSEKANAQIIKTKNHIDNEREIDYILKQIK